MREVLQLNGEGRNNKQKYPWFDSLPKQKVSWIGHLNTTVDASMLLDMKLLEGLLYRYNVSIKTYIFIKNSQKMINLLLSFHRMLLKHAFAT